MYSNHPRTSARETAKATLLDSAAFVQNRLLLQGYFKDGDIIYRNSPDQGKV